MSTAGPDGVFPRISGKTGQPVGLNVSFRQGGVARDPFALRRIDIYKQSVRDDNLVASIPFGIPGSTAYPLPAVPDPTQDGVFIVPFTIPDTFKEGIYFDVWRFVGSEPEDLSTFDFDDENFWISQCNKFWVFQDCWFLDDGLVTPRFGFEPLDKDFRKGEMRNLEVGLMPLPLYDWDQNRIGPIIPQICPFITIETEEGEILEGLEKAKCQIGLRQGTYRTNPYVVQCPLDTSKFLKGQYRYRVTLELPNGDTLISKPFRFKII